MISNVEVKKALKEYFSIEDNSDKEVFVIKTNGDNYIIGEKISKLNIRMDILNEIENQKKLTETEKKENLKVYETPSNMFDIVFICVHTSNTICLFVTVSKISNSLISYLVTIPRDSDIW